MLEEVLNTPLTHLYSFSLEKKIKEKLFAPFCDAHSVCVALQTIGNNVGLKRFCYIVICLEAKVPIEETGNNREGTLSVL